MKTNTPLEFKDYYKPAMQPMTPYFEGMNMDGISISKPDKKDGSPKVGDMIAINTKNPKDMWLVAAKFFKDNYKSAGVKAEDPSTAPGPTPKTLGNTTANGATKNVKDIKFWGDGDAFKLISKASSEAEGWMKSSKAMKAGNDVVLQVTTQQRNIDGTYSIAEALTTIPTARIVDVHDKKGKVVSRVIESS